MVDDVGIIIEQFSTTLGLGNFTLTTKNARRTFNEQHGVGGSDKFYYFIMNREADEWEHGTGHLADPTTLVRDTVIQSSNADALVNFSAGIKDVVSDRPGDLPLLVGNITFIPEAFVHPAGFNQGVDNSITLSTIPASDDQLLIFMEGNITHPGVDWGRVGALVTFTSTIPIDIDRIQTYILSGGGILIQERTDDINITASGTFNIAHGFGGAPKVIEPSLICTTTEHGYSVGDELLVATLALGHGNMGVSVRRNGTNILGQFGADDPTFRVPDLTNGSYQNITNTSWDLRLRSMH